MLIGHSACNFHKVYFVNFNFQPLSLYLAFVFKNFKYVKNTYLWRITAGGCE